MYLGRIIQHKLMTKAFIERGIKTLKKKIKAMKIIREGKEITIHLFVRKFLLELSMKITNPRIIASKMNPSLGQTVLHYQDRIVTTK